MIGVLGNRQQELLTLLLKHKSGMTVDEISRELQITRNAVRQHVTALENDGLVAHGLSRPSGGRPEQLYVLSEQGKEFFPRQYSWFAELVVDSIREEAGADGLRARLAAMGARIGEQMRKQNPGIQGRQQLVEKLAQVMQQLGYSTGGATLGDAKPVIEADNCIFHNLAMKNPDICEFDLALLSRFTDSKVDHQECMAKGGNVCRFKFGPKQKV